MIRQAPEQSLPAPAFDALREAVYRVADRMSRDQVIELADSLFDYARERSDARMAPRAV